MLKWIKDYSRLVFAGFAWALVLVVLVLNGLDAVDHADTQDKEATKQVDRVSGSGVSPSCNATPPATDAEPAQLTQHGATLTTVPFGRDTGTRVREFEYEITDPATLLDGADCLQVEVGPFLRDTGDTQLNPERVMANANVVGNRAVLKVDLSRDGDRLGMPGSYSGSVRIIDPRVQRTDISLQVTMSYPYWQFPVAMLVFVLLPALIYVWLVKGSFTSQMTQTDPTKPEPLTAITFQGYVFSRNGIISIGAGVVAAVSFFSATYLSGATWGSDITQWITLFGGMFAAFAAAATAVTAAAHDKTA